MADTKILLEEKDIPTHWYNVVADMPNRPAPPLGPDGKPVGPEALAAIFPMALIEQERLGRTLDSPFPRRCARPTACGGPAPCSAPTGSNKPWAHRPGSTTSTKAFRPPARTSPTPRCRRPGTTSRPASGAWPPKPALASGAPRSPWSGRCSASTCVCTWSRCPTSRSPSAAP